MLNAVIRFATPAALTGHRCINIPSSVWRMANHALCRLMYFLTSIVLALSS